MCTCVGSVCKCACVSVRVGVCVCACACVNVHVWVCMCECACVSVRVCDQFAVSHRRGG